MNIYIVVALLMLLFFLIEQGTRDENIKKILFYLGSFIVVGLLAFRSEYIGGDTYNYCGYFGGSGGMYGTYENNDTFELGFRWLCSVLILISRSNFWFIFSTSLITILPFIYLINRDCKQSKILPLCLYSMMLWSILSVTQTAIRQNMSVSALMIAYIVFTSSIKQKWVKYVVTALCLAFAFISHTSSLVALPLFIVAIQIPFNKTSALITVIGSLVFILVFSNVFSGIFNMFASYMSGIEMAQHMLDTYYQNSDYALDQEISFNRLGPATLLVSLLIWMSKEEDFKSPYLRCLVFGCALYNIGALFPMIFRTLYALLYFGIIYVPSFLNKKANLIPKAVMILLMVFFIRTFYVYARPHQDDQMLPYTFIWE